MKTQTVITYSAAELKEQFPDGFKRAHEHFIRQNREEVPWMDETIDSLKKCISAAGLKLLDWNLGAYNRNNGITVSFPNDETEELSGKRAMAWLENNLFAFLRIPWTGKARKELRRYGSCYYAGKIKPCPLTGYFADEDYMQSLRDDVRNGYTLKEAFEGLASVCERLLEAEIEATQEEEYFIEEAEAREMQFTEDGQEF